MNDRLPVWRRIAIGASLLVTCVVFLRVVDGHYAIADWLFWRYLRVWAWTLTLAIGAFGVGDWMVTGLVGRIRGIYAHWFTSFCVGLLTYGVVSFGAGMLQWYATWFFYALPVVGLALAAPRIWGYFRDTWPRLRRHAPLRLHGAWPIVVFVFGMYAFLMIYAGVLTPHNIMFDSQWKHVAIAETYTAHGGIFRFEQGWMFAARPQFASYLFSWAFLMPNSELFDRIVLCGHLEFVVFAATTVLGVPALVRRILPDADPTLVWVVRFLFPGIFLYDSNLSIGADHIAAAFAIPIFIVVHDFVRDGLTVRRGVLTGVLTAGVLMTKETAAAMMIPQAGFVVVVGAVVAAVRARKEAGPWLHRNRWVLGLVAIGVAGLAVSSPLWLKNILWYGDPLYPNLYQYFDSRPWTEDATYYYEWGFKDYQFGLWVKDEGHELEETLKVLFTWSFIPHNWGPFHGKRPVIGSLLTMLLPCLLFLRTNRRLWWLTAWIHAGIAIWFRVLPQDRYLQVLMPWMTAWTAVVLVLLWRARVRTIVTLLVAAQIVWGGDVYFLYRNMLPKLVSLFSASRDAKKMEHRLETQGTFAKVGEYLPAGARLIVHETHPRLGVGVPAYDDWVTNQFGLAYGLLRSPAEVWTAYQQMGITHLWWKDGDSRAENSVAGDLMFFDTALRHTVLRKRIGKSIVGTLPSERPVEDEAHFNDVVAVIGCKSRGAPRGYQTGLYRIRDLHVPIWGPRNEDFPEPRVSLAPGQKEMELVEQAGYVVIDPACGRAVGRRLGKDYYLAAKRRRVGGRDRGYQIYVKLEDRPPPRDWGEDEG